MINDQVKLMFICHDLQPFMPILYRIKQVETIFSFFFKGTQMIPPRVLVSPCLGKCNCHDANLCFFLCSLDDFLLKKCYFFSFGNQNSEWFPFEMKCYSDLLFTFFSYRENTHKKILQDISYLLTYTYFWNVYVLLIFIYTYVQYRNTYTDYVQYRNTYTYVQYRNFV